MIVCKLMYKSEIILFIYFQITLLETNNYSKFKKGNKLDATLTSLHKLLLSHLLAYNIKSYHFSNVSIEININHYLSS